MPICQSATLSSIPESWLESLRTESLKRLPPERGRFMDCFKKSAIEAATEGNVESSRERGRWAGLERRKKVSSDLLSFPNWTGVLICVRVDISLFIVCAVL
mmetsp:Transcript_38268/g.51827  ORF Transcript_38268/g.51827 Transcript_38268/m.51827 type:complete len:101 (-) Transcript_38268:77-379(-)